MNRRNFLGVITLGAVGSVVGATLPASQQEPYVWDVVDSNTTTKLTLESGAIIIHGTPMMSEEAIAEQVQRAMADMLDDLSG